MFKNVVFILAAAFALANCGGGGDDLPTLVRDASAAGLSRKEPFITDTGPAHYQIGTPDLRTFVNAISGEDPRTMHGSARVWHERVSDGTTKRALFDYLQADASDQENSNWILRWDKPPTVRLVEGASPQDRRDALMAVQLINSTLPPQWQLQLSNTDAPVTRIQRNENTDEETYVNSEGFIDIAFTPIGDWPGEGCGHEKLAVGCAWTGHVPGKGIVRSGNVRVDPDQVESDLRMYVLLHELLHTLGRGHVDDDTFPNTIMHELVEMGDDAPDSQLRALDEAALYAIYGRLGTGMVGEDLSMDDLGEWSDRSTHVIGSIQYDPVDANDVIWFGAVWQNDLVRPYSFNRADDRSPSLRQSNGNARWEGRLIGLTPDANSVVGTMEMTVQFPSLDGDLDFTDLEYWAAHAVPGVLGSGNQWRDGDLHYNITVAGGILIVDTEGDDDGEITGAFFGTTHEAVGGTLKRADLSAGFGGERQP